MRPSRQSQAGQAMIETLVVSAAILASLSALLILCYLSSLKIYADHLMHEALVCQQSFSLHQLPERCGQELRQKLSRALIGQRLGDLQWIKSKNKVGLSIQLHAKEPSSPLRLVLDVTFTKVLALPLQI